MLVKENEDHHTTGLFLSFTGCLNEFILLGWVTQDNFTVQPHFGLIRS